MSLSSPSGSSSHLVLEATLAGREHDGQLATRHLVERVAQKPDVLGLRDLPPMEVCAGRELERQRVLAEVRSASPP